MIRVLRIINRFNLGGPTYNVAYLTKYMPSEFKTILVGGKHEDDEISSDFILQSMNIKPMLIPAMRRVINFKKDLIAYEVISDIIKRYKPHIVHTHAAKAGTLGRMAAFAANVPIIVHTFHGHVFHSYFNNYKTIFYKTIERRLAQSSTRIIAISDTQKNELANIYNICNEDKIEIIPLGFDLDRFNIDKETKRIAFRRHYNIDDDEIAIGIIGRIVPIKNHSLFIEAIKYIQNKTTKKIRAFIIGDGDDRHKIEIKAKQLGLNYTDFNISKEKALITFTSWIKEIDYANAGMDIIALTSFNEGTPVSLIEAQASGVPIISTNVGGVKDIMIPNKTGILCNSFEYNEFGEKLLNLVENDNFRLNLSKKGWSFVKEKYHYSRLINDMTNLYYKLIDEKKVKIK